MKKIRLIKSTPDGSIGNKIKFAKNYGKDIFKNKAALTGIKFDDIVVEGLVDSIEDDEKLSQDGDMAATKRFHLNLELFSEMYYQNGLYCEEKDNLAGNTNLSTLLKYKEQLPHGPQNKPSARGENTNIKGMLKIILLCIKVANHYDIYGALVSDLDGSIGVAEKIGLIGKATGNCKGFISGGKYSVYAIPVDSNGNEGEPTASFIIRVS